MSCRRMSATIESRGFHERGACITPLSSGQKKGRTSCEVRPVRPTKRPPRIWLCRSAGGAPLRGRPKAVGGGSSEAVTDADLDAGRVLALGVGHGQCRVGVDHVGGSALVVH